MVQIVQPIVRILDKLNRPSENYSQGNIFRPYSLHEGSTCLKWISILSYRLSWAQMRYALKYAQNGYISRDNTEFKLQQSPKNLSKKFQTKYLHRNKLRQRVSSALSAGPSDHKNAMQYPPYA